RTAEDDGPLRAELSGCKIEKRARKAAEVVIEINYIAPPHVARTAELFRREKVRLESVLQEYPVRAVNRITEWPFALEVRFTFNGQPLTTVITGGKTREQALLG